MEELELLKKKVSILEKQLSEKDKIIKDPSRRGYYALSRMAYQQIEYLENFDLKKQIESNPKDDKVYDRAKGLWEGLKTMIMDCRTLKQELKITPDDEEKEMKKIYRTTPESIADEIGNIAGQNQ